MSTESLEFNKEENSLSLSEEGLKEALKENEPAIKKISRSIQRQKEVDEAFGSFLAELDHLFDKIK